MADLIQFDPVCRQCPRLAEHLTTIKAQYPSYHAGPVAAFGDDNARLLVVGLAPGLHGANATGRPFTGDFAGLLLYATLHQFGYANRPDAVAQDDGLALANCRITNAVKCLPPKNQPLPAEITTCNRFLTSEIDSLPSNAVILALGLIAHQAVLKACGLKPKQAVFAHNAQHPLPGGRVLVDSYHTSRYNIQTKRLTEAQFHAVFARIAKLMAMP